MEITLFQLIVNIISVGASTKLFGWMGLVGSVMGALVYFIWAQPALFGRHLTPMGVQYPHSKENARGFINRKISPHHYRHRRS